MIVPLDEQTDLVYEDHLPSQVTLKKYGLSVVDWVELYTRKNGCCHVCGRSFHGIRANIDHEHVRGWKQMTPAQRKQHIRGLLCYTCNKFMMMRGITSDKLLRGYQYMRGWEVRVQADEPSLRAAQDVDDGGTDEPRRPRQRRTHHQPQ